jgi:transposase-like protein
LIYGKRNRTSTKDIGYGVYLYFLGLSYRNTSKALSEIYKKKSYFYMKMYSKLQTRKNIFQKKKISEFIIDETQIKVGQDYFWIWVVIDSTNKITILGIHISSLERNMLIAVESLHSI